MRDASVANPERPPMPTYQDLLASARTTVPESDVAAVRHSQENARPVLLDIREQDEVDQGMVSGAIHIPRGFLELRVEQVVPDRDTPVVVYCASGVRSLLAARALQDLGYSNVASLQGGFNAWKDAGAPWATPRSLTPDQRRRYSRHLLLPDVGEEGQAALLDAKILLIGAGGLGSPAALYLAAAGVGTLGIIDDDVVDASNLQRQVIHTTDRIGEPKVESARLAIEALNPDVERRRDPGSPEPGEHLRDHRWLRRDRGRFRQLCDALPAQRRGGPAEEAGGARQHLPVRRPGDGTRPAR